MPKNPPNLHPEQDASLPGMLLSKPNPHDRNDLTPVFGLEPVPHPHPVTILPIHPPNILCEHLFVLHDFGEYIAGDC